MIKLFKNNIAYVHGLRVGREFLRHKKHRPQRKRLTNQTVLKLKTIHQKMPWRPKRRTQEWEKISAARIIDNIGKS